MYNIILRDFLSYLTPKYYQYNMNNEAIADIKLNIYKTEQNKSKYLLLDYLVAPVGISSKILLVKHRQTSKAHSTVEIRLRGTLPLMVHLGWLNRIESIS